MTLAELKTSWNLEDLADAHDTLDLLEKLDAKARAKELAQRDRD